MNPRFTITPAITQALAQTERAHGFLEALNLRHNLRQICAPRQNVCAVRWAFDKG